MCARLGQFDSLEDVYDAYFTSLIWASNTVFSIHNVRHTGAKKSVHN